MRTPEEMMTLIMDFARDDDRIRIVGMEGSRVNASIPKDDFQDFDVTYFTTSMDEFTKDDSWLSYFGNVLLVQKPESMELYPVVQDGHSYLVLFDDYNKIDFTLLEKCHLAGYLNEDKLRTILLDKDGDVPQPVVATDAEYWIQKPSAISFDDCCNEFWNLTTYVVKGLCRREILFAIDHFQLMRDELLRMISWKVGLEHGYTFSVGKNYKFIDHYITPELWQALLSTYRLGSYDEAWQALFTSHTLFRNVAAEFAEAVGYTYPAYDQNVSPYVQAMYAKYGGSAFRLRF